MVRRNIEPSRHCIGRHGLPGGGTVTRLIQLDLPVGGWTLFARDFPLALDPSSLRVEGEAGDRFVIGAVDSRQPFPMAGRDGNFQPRRAPMVCRHRHGFERPSSFAPPSPPSSEVGSVETPQPADLRGIAKGARRA